MPYRTFGLDEVAAHLDLSRDQVQRLVQDRAIPFEKHGPRLVFRKVEVDAWASQRILGLESRRLSDYDRKLSGSRPSPKTIIEPMLRPEYINPTVAAKTKASVLREMAALADSTGLVTDSRRLLTSLQQREALCSTGLPGGLAVLHMRTPEPYVFESAFVALGRTVQEIPFGAPDGRSTDLFFLLACPDDQLHLHTLARICLMAQKTDLIACLRAAPGAPEMYTCLVEAERQVLPGH